MSQHNEFKQATIPSKAEEPSQTPDILPKKLSPTLAGDIAKFLVPNDSKNNLRSVDLKDLQNLRFVSKFFQRSLNNLTQGLKTVALKHQAEQRTKDWENLSDLLISILEAQAPTMNKSERLCFPSKDKIERIIKIEDMRAKALAIEGCEIGEETHRTKVRVLLNLIAVPLLEYLKQQNQALLFLKPDSETKNDQEFPKLVQEFILFFKKLKWVLKKQKELKQEFENDHQLDSITEYTTEYSPLMNEVDTQIELLQKKLNVRMNIWVGEHQRLAVELAKEEHAGRENLVLQNRKEAAAKKIRELAAQGAHFAGLVYEDDLPRILHMEPYESGDLFLKRPHKLLDIAIIKGNADLAILLIDLGIRVDTHVYELAIQQATWRNDLKILQRILDIQLPDQVSLLDLWGVAFRESLNLNKATILELFSDVLVKLNLKFDLTTYPDSRLDQKFIIMDAIQKNNHCLDPEILRVILEKFEEFANVLNMLLPDIQDRHHRTIDAACFSIDNIILLTREEILEIFNLRDDQEQVDAPLDLRFQDPHIPITPLMLAAINLSEDHVKLLIQHGADPGIKDKMDRTALDYASKIFNVLKIKADKFAPHEVEAWNIAKTRFENIKLMLTHPELYRDQKLTSHIEHKAEKSVVRSQEVSPSYGFR